MPEAPIVFQGRQSIALTELPPLSLYVHFPWCLRKCPYCDFNSHALPADGVPQTTYLNALLSDLQTVLPLVWGRSVQSVFIGGGTPSLLTPDGVNELLSQLRALLPLVPGCEITLEANPGTFEADRFQAFSQAGVTRLSLGVQSFNDQKLKALGRVHNAAQACAAIEEVQKHFATFNLDLMYALPAQSLDELSADLDTALGYQPPHISIYHLTMEPNTYFAKYPPQVPDDDLAAEMLDLITERTGRAGMLRYEISAYAKTGHQCAHNRNYWEFGDYIGIGAGAHGKISFPDRIVRQVKHRDPMLYMQKALQGQALAQEHVVAPDELAFEFMLNALRLKEGVALRLLTQRTGLPVQAVTDPLERAVQQGLLENDGLQIRPSAKGFDFLSDLQEMFLPPT